MTSANALAESKVPEVTILFWVLQIAATTLGETGGDAIFIGLLLLIVALYRWSEISHTALFWAAFVLTRPLGAVLGDFLDKPIEHGGLALDRYWASVVLLVFMIG